jgi:hypothetical protein
MTVEEYKRNLRENIMELHRKLVSREYRAQPARRVWIPKGDGASDRWPYWCWRTRSCNERWR